MNQQQILQYGDLIWRIEEVATENEALRENAAISLAVPVVDPSQQGIESPVLLAFLYTFHFDNDEGDDGSSAPERPEILPAYALIHIRLDGELVKWKLLHRESGQHTLGPRFTGLASEMEPDEQEAFIETYYEILTSHRGPLWQSWHSVEAAIRKDLRELFHTFVEMPFLPLYRQYAPEFLKFIGMPS